MEDNVNRTNGEISIGTIFKALWLGKWWIIVCVALACGLSFLAYSKLPRMYKAEAIVMPADGASSGQMSGSVAGLAALAGVDLGNDSTNMEEAIAILESGQFIRQFIDERIPLSVLFADSWDDQTKAWKKEVESNVPTLNDAQRHFLRDILTIRRLPKGQALSISIIWDDRTQAALWVNELVERINETMRQRALRSAEESLSYLEAELASVNILGVRQGIYGLIEEQIKRVMLANVKPQYAFKVIDPAVVSDEDDHHSPKLLLLLIGGLFFGGVAGSLIALLWVWRTGRM